MKISSSFRFKFALGCEARRPFFALIGNAGMVVAVRFGLVFGAGMAWRRGAYAESRKRATERNKKKRKMKENKKQKERKEAKERKKNKIKKEK